MLKMKENFLVDMDKVKNKLYENADPNEKVDDYFLNKSIGLDGEKMVLYNKFRDWAESVEDLGFIAQLDYDERKDKVVASLQEKKGGKYLMLNYSYATKILEIGYYNYNDAKDHLEQIESEKTNSPSNIDYLLKKYKNFLMEKKQPLTEAKDKIFNEAQIDELIRKASSSIHKLKEAVRGHLDGGKFLTQLDAIYKVLQDTPSLMTLKKQLEREKQEKEAQKAAKLRSSVQEDIKIDAKADPNTVRKAEELAKKHNTDIELTTESISVGELKKILKESAIGEQIVTDPQKIKKYVIAFNNKSRNETLSFASGYYDLNKPKEIVNGVILADSEGENGSFHYVVLSNGNYKLQLPQVVENKKVLNKKTLYESLLTEGEKKK